MRFSLRALLLWMISLAGYFSLLPRYGYGRAFVCLLTIYLGASSVLFFATAWTALVDEQHRNAIAAAALGSMILSGAIVIGTIVFHPPTMSVF